MMTFTDQFGKTHTLYLQRQKYSSGHARLNLIDAVDHCPYATCTTNIQRLETDEVAIKNYSENLGILELLIENKIISEPHRVLQENYVIIPICKLI
jgi:hypothetical protein